MALPDVVKLRRALEQGEKVFEQPPLVPKRRAPKPAVEQPAEVAELAQWFKSHPGPQRQLLTDFEATWLPKVLGLGDDARAAAAKLVAREVKSPKLEADRARVIAKLGPGDSSK